MFLRPFDMEAFDLSLVLSAMVEGAVKEETGKRR